MGQRGSRPVPILPTTVGARWADHRFKFENLVFEGGGAKGIAYIGVSGTAIIVAIIITIRRTRRALCPAAAKTSIQNETVQGWLQATSTQFPNVTNTTASVTVSMIASGQADQGQYQDSIRYQNCDIGNTPGPSPGIGLSSSNTTSTVVTSSHGQTLQGLSPNELPVALQPNPMYNGTQSNPPKTTCPEITGDDYQATKETYTHTTYAVKTCCATHLYEDMDEQNYQALQDQCQAAIESNTSCSYAAIASGHVQSEQDQSTRVMYTTTVKTSGHAGLYKNMDSQHYQLLQGQCLTNSTSNTTTTAAAVNNGNGQTVQDQSETTNSSDIHTLAVPMKNIHDKKGQNQFQIVTEHSENIGSTTMLSGHDETGQIQSQSFTESNTSTTTTVMVSGHDHTVQDQSHAITESNTTNTTTVMVSGHDRTVQDQSQAITESNTNTTTTVIASGHHHTEQDQSYSITENKVPETPQGSKPPLDEPPPLPPKRKGVVAPSE
uniref:Uncharacterized protein n=1 Tax=Branchiostoma floridae TaxID=7739 RepID=C3YUW4_BRAFL|eukprot:XP_002600003.1 hypothetical protein BRAFLDRAFT_74121 [Branchiostoma floridae]